LSEKRPDHRAPLALLQVPSPSQLPLLVLTGTQRMRAGRLSMLHFQSPPHQPLTVLAWTPPTIDSAAASSASEAGRRCCRILRM